MEEDTLSLTTLVTVGEAVVTMINKSLASLVADEVVVVSVVAGEVVCGVTGVAEGVLGVVLDVVEDVVVAGGAGLGVGVTFGVVVVPLV